jgi:5-methylcytosine-specific restriction endonuclease McrA
MCEEKTKVCSKCEIEKPLTEYHKQGNGLRANCKECKRAIDKQYRQENSEKEKARQKKWREDNPEYGKKWREENSEYGKKWREDNPGYGKKYGKKYRQENSEKEKARMKKWREENPEYIKKWFRDNREKARLYCQKRRALLLEATTEHFTHEDLLDFWSENEINYKECFYCEKEMSEGPEHIDHYYPLSKGGPHERANLRPSCAHCNLSKHAKQPETFMEELNNGL